jgi:hypothetical protein
MKSVSRHALQLGFRLREPNTRASVVSIFFPEGRAPIDFNHCLGCGNAVVNGGGPAPDGNAGCTMACKGNSAETCGGPNRLDVYQYSSSGSGGGTPTGTGKRGLAYNNNNPGANAEYANLFRGYSKVSWGYDWGYPSYNLDSSFEL